MPAWWGVIAMQLLLGLSAPATQPSTLPATRAQLETIEDASHALISSLHDAAKMNDIHSVRILLDGGTRVDVTDPIGNTPLHWAALDDNEEMIRLLIDHGANINAQNKSGRTPLHYAAYANANRADAALSGAGAKSDLADRFGQTPVALARSRGAISLANIPFREGFGVAATQAAAALQESVIKGDLKRVRAALDAGADASGMLNYAAQFGDARMVELLLGYHADPNKTDRQLGRSTLQIAIRYGKDFHVVEMLLAGGANPFAADDTGRTPVDEAKDLGDEWLVQLLQADWKRVDEPDEDGHSRLDRAAFVGDPYYARLTIEKGANVNARDRDGRTPLHTAVAWGQREIAELLVGRNADVNAVDHYGLTPLFDVHDAELAEWLITKGAKLDARDKTGQTPLHWAAASGNEKVAAALVKAGADPNVVDKFGRTPAEVAREEHKDALAKLLSR